MLKKDEYLKAFNLEGYRKISNMDDPYVGVSLIIDHDKRLIQKLKLRDEKWIALINVYLEKNWTKTQDNMKSIHGRVVLTIDSNDNQYLMIDKRKFGANIPIDIYSKDEYFFDINTNKFYKCSSEITFKNIVDELFNLHLKTTKPISGFILRLKIMLFNFLEQSTLFLAKFIAFICYILFGEKVPYDFFSEYMQKKDITEPTPIKKSKKISIFGYEASVHLISFFCLCHLIIFVSAQFYQWNNPIIISIFNNNFLTLAYSILVLYILEEYMHPSLKGVLKWLISIARNLHEKLEGKEIKIS